MATVLRTTANPTLLECGAMPVYAVVVCGALFIALTVALTDFTYDAALLNGAVIPLIVGALGGAALKRYGLRVGSGIEAICLFSGLSLMAPLCAVILASSAYPLADQWLAELDHRLFFGFERGKIALAVVAQPWLMKATELVYHSLIVQPSFLLVLLYGTGREIRGWTLLLAWGLSLAVILAIFPFFPAVGAPPYFLDFMATFNGARDGSLRVLGEEALTGIVTFPSFHAAAAVLLGWGFAPIRRIGPAMVVLNALMFLSALVAGHYLIDLVAGGAIAAACIVAAKHVQLRITSPGRKAPKDSIPADLIAA